MTVLEKKKLCTRWTVILAVITMGWLYVLDWMCKHEIPVGGIEWFSAIVLIAGMYCCFAAYTRYDNRLRCSGPEEEHF